jgi:hypothetical protein
MSDSSPITAFVQAILEVTAPIMEIRDRMLRAPDEPDVLEVVFTMKRLLEDVLAPLESAHDLRSATASLDAASKAILANFYFVPPRRTPRPRRRRTSH